MKHLNLTVLLTMLLCMFGAKAQAHDFAVANDDGVTIYYNIINDSEVEVCYRGKQYNSYSDEYSGDIVVPASVTYNNKTYDVTRIGYRAFWGCTGLTSITIPDNVIKISQDAFASTAWYDNQPNGLVYAGKNLYAYKGEMPQNTNINLEEGTVSVTDGAFWNCNELISVTIPKSVKDIGQLTFSGCSNLASLVVESGNDIYDSRNNCNAIILTSEHKLLVGCKTTIIPDDVLSIGECAFYGCSNLSTLKIPQGITSIGEYAFYGCCSLISITIPNGVRSIGDYTFNGCSSLISISIPDGVTSIGSTAFCGCSGLTSIAIPNSVETIGVHAFSECYGLSSVTIPDNVKEIQFGTFNSCKNLTSVIIGNGVTNIARWAFMNCESLTDVTIGNNLTSIEYGAFTGCKINSIYISDLLAWCKVATSDNPFSYSHHLYLNGQELKSLEIPDGITIIGSIPFQNCAYLTSVSIPNSVTSIGNEAFSGCNSLESITLGNNLKSIGNESFYGCSSLISIDIPSCVETIGEQAFYGCSNVTTLNLPDNITLIRNQSFMNCNKLTSITIPESVVAIYQEAFAGCNNLNYVKVLPETPPFLYDNSFSKFSVTLRVPKGSKEVYQSAQGWKNFTNIIDADKYKLIYMVDGEEYKSYDVKEGANITAEAAPIKEGYTFSGWSEIPETMPAHDVTITGTFSINKYKVTYIVGGVEYKTIELEFGSVITPEADPTKEGYTFSGWSEIPNTVPSHDVTITGSFTINKYKLSYIVDGVDYKTNEIEYGATITPEDVPAKEGFTFNGWSEIPETMPAHDVTITGTFSINKYKVTYIVDGVEYKSSELEYGSVITPEADPTKEGYTFSGWSEIPNTVPSHDVTITGSFTINKYILTYKVDDVEYKTIEVEYGTSLTPIDEPTKTGYTFTGWVGLPETMPAHDVTVIGSFSKGAYLLTYMIDGVVYKTVSYDYEAKITPETPTKEGYTFNGWIGLPDTMPANNITVTGSFTINKYKLIYVVDDKVYESYEIEYGATITPEDVLAKEGYTFSGWSEIPKTMPAHDITVIGSFSINSYKLTYVLDGVEYKTATIEYGKTITPESVPTKEGYSFSGWTDLPETMPAHDVTVTGSYTINKYKIVYMVDGVEYGSSEVEYGAEVNPIGEPSKEGYTFSGWQNLPEEMPAHDVTVSGTFIVNQYKVTFKYGKNVLTTIEVDYGAVIPLPGSLNSERYTLIEWLDVPDTMPAHDIIIYADYVDGIETIAVDSTDAQYIQMNGMYTNELKKGVNVIRTKEGKTRKILVK